MRLPAEDGAPVPSAAQGWVIFVGPERARSSLLGQTLKRLGKDLPGAATPNPVSIQL